MCAVVFGGFVCLVQLPEGAEKLGPMAGQTAHKPRRKIPGKGVCFFAGSLGGRRGGIPHSIRSAFGYLLFAAGSAGGGGRCACEHPSNERERASEPPPLPRLREGVAVLMAGQKRRRAGCSGTFAPSHPGLFHLHAAGQTFQNDFADRLILVDGEQPQTLDKVLWNADLEGDKRPVEFHHCRF